MLARMGNDEPLLGKSLLEKELERHHIEAKQNWINKETMHVDRGREGGGDAGKCQSTEGNTESSLEGESTHQNRAS